MAKSTNKRYVKEDKNRNQDGELLTTVNVYKSKPKDFDYIVFV
ncbi:MULTISPECIES: hypothetical protein [Alkalibacillus]|uniref:Uncharacterized protein n=1 Tax=Alkalibacillus salilacus TaxID=284582 RepID=A0ABT9VDH1_9BACI|nr:MULTISPECIES: hypothetical protein [Alkalibacillus]MDQ0158993.1 hypothetical protein [Alkalibacillus salilacus]NIK10890.1 hypothetical protein [Alkalibacillus almallahensis]